MGKRFLLLIVLTVLLSDCIGSLNPFKKEEKTYTPYIPKETPEKVSLKGVENVVYFLGKTFAPKKGMIVLNSYDGYLIDLGKKDGISVGDTFISEKTGSVLKVREVRKEYCIALPTLGNPFVGEKVEKLLYNSILFLDFTSQKGKRLYSEIREKLPFLKLADYKKGEEFKKKYSLRFPSDFKRKVPTTELTDYDGYFVVSSLGVSVYDSMKKLVKIFPWNGSPVSSFSALVGAENKVVKNLKGHATSLCVVNLDNEPRSEIVVLEEDSIKVYRANSYGITLLYSFKNPFPESYLFHVSYVMGKDQKPELLINGFYRSEKRVISGVFRIKGRKLVKLATSSFIISGFDENGDGLNETIYGQEVSKKEGEFFGKKVYKLSISGNKLKPVEEVKVPEGFQVSSAQILNVNKNRYFVYYDSEYFLKVSSGEKVVWSSPIQIGASPNCIYWYEEDNLISYYITPKPKLFDFDGDGKLEVLFSQNKNVVPGILRNVYTFDGGRILLLEWVGDTFDWKEATTPLYKHGGIEEFGYVPEYDIFVSIFTKSGIFKNPKSSIVIMKPLL